MENHVSWENRGGLMALAVLGCVLFEKTCATTAEKEAAIDDFKGRIESLKNQLSDTSAKQPAPVVVEWPANTDFINGLSSFASFLDVVLLHGTDEGFTYPF